MLRNRPNHSLFWPYVSHERRAHSFAAAATLIGAIVLLLAPTTPAQTRNIKQSSGGFCSPPINEVVGDVTVICNGVSPKALARLNAHLATVNKTLAEKIQEADQWAAWYFDLKRKLEMLQAPEEDYKMALALIDAGELEQSEAILKPLADKQGTEAAAPQFALGRTYQMSFNRDGALEYLRKAYTNVPDNLQYALAYAEVLYSGTQVESAAKVLSKATDAARQLSGGPDPVRFAEALALLGDVYLDSGDDDRAIIAIKEAWGIRQSLLGNQDPQEQRIAIAQLEAELGSAYLAENQLTNAIDVEELAIRDFTQLATEGVPLAVYHRGAILGNVAGVYKLAGRFEEAEVSAKRALGDLTEEARKRPSEINWEVAGAHNTLAAIYILEGKLPLAFAESEAALRLANDPQTLYQSAEGKAMFLARANLLPSGIYAALGDCKRALAAQKEAEKNYQKLETSENDAVRIEGVLALNQSVGIALNCGQEALADALLKKSLQTIMPVKPSYWGVALDRKLETILLASTVYQGMGRSNDAIQVLQDGWKLVDQYYAQKASRLITPMATFGNLLGKAFIDSNRLPEADIVLKETWTRLTEVSGADPDTLTAFKAMVATTRAELEAEKKNAAACVSFKETAHLEYVKQYSKGLALAEDHVVESVRDLAELYRFADGFHATEKELRDTKAVIDSYYDRNPGKFLEPMTSIASLLALNLAGRGELSEAGKIVSDLRQRMKEATHADANALAMSKVLTTGADASIECHGGVSTSCLDLMEDGRRQYAELFGRDLDHVDESLLDLVDSLAEAYRAKGSFEQSEKAVRNTREIVDVYYKVKPSEYVIPMARMGNLHAICLVDLKRLPDAENVLAEVRERLKTVSGVEPDTMSALDAMTIATLGRLQREKKDEAVAVTSLESARRQYTALYKKGHEDLGDGLATVAEDLYKLYQLQKKKGLSSAEMALRETKEAFESKSLQQAEGERHYSTILLLLAIIHYNQNRPQEWLNEARRAETLIRAKANSDNEDLGSALFLIAQGIQQLHLHEDACKYAIDAGRLGPDEIKKVYAKKWEKKCAVKH
jgi:hypothetical protein